MGIKLENFAEELQDLAELLSFSLQTTSTSSGLS